MDGTEVVDLVRRYLVAHPELTIPIDVFEARTRLCDDWWYVTIRPGGDPRPRPYLYYDVLAEIEGEIKENEHLDVLLVPSG